MKRHFGSKKPTRKYHRERLKNRGNPHLNPKKDLIERLTDYFSDRLGLLISHLPTEPVPKRGLSSTEGFYAFKPDKDDLIVL